MAYCYLVGAESERAVSIKRRIMQGQTPQLEITLLIEESILRRCEKALKLEEPSQALKPRADITKRLTPMKRTPMDPPKYYPKKKKINTLLTMVQSIDGTTLHYIEKELPNMGMSRHYHFHLY